MPLPRLTLVLLPGLLNDWRLWKHAIAGMSDVVEPQVVVLSGADSIGALADEVLASAPPAFALAGFSMGGYTAFEVLRRAPERVLGLCLVDTSARPDTPADTAARREAMARATQDFPAMVEAMLRRLAHPNAVDDPDVAEPFRAMAGRIGVDGFLRQQTAIIGRPDSRPTLATIRCHTHIICGRDDLVTPVALHEEMRDGIAGAKLTVLGNCGHLAPLERAEEVTNALRDFTERVPH